MKCLIELGNVKTGAKLLEEKTRDITGKIPELRVVRENCEKGTESNTALIMLGIC